MIVGIQEEVGQQSKTHDDAACDDEHTEDSLRVGLHVGVVAQENG